MEEASGAEAAVGADAPAAADGAEGQRPKGRGGKGKGGKGKGGKGKSKNSKGSRDHDDEQIGSKPERRNNNSPARDGEGGTGGGSKKGGGRHRDGQAGGKGKKGGGKGNRNVCTTLGLPPHAELTHVSSRAAIDQCLLCAETNPTYVGIGRCRHADACWVCTLRLRALARDRRCTVCKEELDQVLITSNANAKLQDLRSLPCDEQIGVWYESEEVRLEAQRLFEYRCSVDDCEFRDRCFRTLNELENHLWYSHWQQFCRTCLHSRPAFLCEQRVYGNRDLDNHCRFGDKACLTGRRPAPPVPAHPLCEFCDHRLYNEDELLRHVHRKHHLCAICERMGRTNEFYSNFRCLALHYSEVHHVCPHKDCLRSGFRLIAFAEEEELHLHMLHEHGDSSRLSDRERKSGMKLQVGHMSYEDSRRRESKGHGKGQRNSSAPDDVQVHFMWPSGATAADCKPDVDASASAELRGGDSDDEGERFERYPTREPIPQRGRSGKQRPPAQAAAKQQPEEQVDDACDADDADGGEEAPDEDSGDDQIDDDSAVDDKAEEEPLLAPELEALSLDCSVAADGPRRSSHSCLNALNSVLVAFLGARGCAVPSEVEDSLRAAVSSLTDKEVEGLHRMQKHLETASGELSRTCEWEALERVLSLWPLFFRLVQAGNASQGRQPIGPKRSSAANGQAAVDTSGNWRQWKLAAQEAVQALGRRERSCLAAYVRLCLRRRAAISDAIERGVLEEAFPTLGGGSGAAEPAELTPTANAWAEMRQAAESDTKSFPMLGAAGSAPEPRESDSRGSAAQSNAGGTWGKVNQKQVLPGTDKDLAQEFPTLGGRAGASSRAEEIRWGAGLSSRSTANSSQAQPAVVDGWDDTPPAQARNRGQKPVEVSDSAAFPSLGGASGNAENPAASWAAAARQREAAAAAAAEKAAAAEPVEPEKPKNFKLDELNEGQHFPGLPAAPKKSSPAKASGKAASKAKAKAGSWSKAASLAVPAPAPSSGKEEQTKKAQKASPRPKNGGQKATEPESAVDGPLEDFFPEILSALPSKKAATEKASPPARRENAAAAAAKPKAKAAAAAKPAPIDEMERVTTEMLGSMDNVVVLSKKGQDDDDDGADTAGAGKKKKNNRDKKKNVISLV